ISSTVDDYAKSEEGLKKSMSGETGRQLLAITVEQKKAVLPIVAKIKASADSGNFVDGALLLTSEFQPAHEKWMDSLKVLSENQQRELRAAYDASARSYKNTQLWMAIITVAMIVLGLWV